MPTAAETAATSEAGGADAAPEAAADGGGADGAAGDAPTAATDESVSEDGAAAGADEDTAADEAEGSAESETTDGSSQAPAGESSGPDSASAAADDAQPESPAQNGAGETAAGEPSAAETPSSSEAGDAAAGDPAAEGADGATDAPGLSLPSDDPPVIDEGVPAAESPVAPEAAAPVGDAPTAPAAAPPTASADAPPASAADPGGPADDGTAVAPATAQLGGDVELVRGDEMLELRGRFVPGAGGLAALSPSAFHEVVAIVKTWLTRSDAPEAADSSRRGVAASGERPGIRRPARTRADVAARSVGRHAADRPTRVPRGDAPAARPPATGATGGSARTGWLLAVVLLVFAGSLVAIFRRGHGGRARPAAAAETVPRIISNVAPAESEDDARRARPAVCDGTERRRPSSGARRPAGHLRAVPEREERRGLGYERERHADDGRDRRRERVAA